MKQDFNNFFRAFKNHTPEETKKKIFLDAGILESEFDDICHDFVECMEVDDDTIFDALKCKTSKDFNWFLTELLEYREIDDEDLESILIELFDKTDEKYLPKFRKLLNKE